MWFRLILLCLGLVTSNSCHSNITDKEQGFSWRSFRTCLSLLPFACCFVVCPPSMNPWGRISRGKREYTKTGENSWTTACFQSTEDKWETFFPTGSSGKQHTLVEPEVAGLQVRLHGLNNTCNKHISLRRDRNKLPFYPFRNWTESHKRAFFTVKLKGMLCGVNH